MSEGKLPTPRHVGWDLKDGYRISTVRLTVEHGGGMHYETMVFNEGSDGKTDFADLYCRRYATRAEAEEGHKATVAEVIRLVFE